MSPHTQEYTIGVEEEYQIVDPVTRELRSRAERVLPEAHCTPDEEVMHELYLSQIETATPVCATLGEVRTELTRLRRELILAAAKDGHRIAAAGTHPFSHWQDQRVTPKDRYLGVAADFGQIARELIIFGCHVHVGLSDPEAAVLVMNRARVWLAPMLALSANSPYWLGTDTEYASYRTELWVRFPMAGPPLIFGSRAEHDELVHTLIATGSIENATKIYWDIRLPERVPTVEVRVADVCMTVDEAVMIAGLARALVRTCHEGSLHDKPYAGARPELLRAAHWRAARNGLDGTLVDVHAGRSVPARELVESMLAFLRPALEEFGDWDEVSAIVRETLARGNGANRQREAYRRAGRLEDVVDLMVSETAIGTEAGA